MKALIVALMVAPMTLLSGCVTCTSGCPDWTVPYGTYNITDSSIDTLDEGVVNFNSDTLVVQYSTNDSGFSNWDDKWDNFKLCPEDE
jgi:major membrane immunogen (membrane-anchored lipoprotein)